MSEKREFKDENIYKRIYSMIDIEEGRYKIFRDSHTGYLILISIDKSDILRYYIGDNYLIMQCGKYIYQIEHIYDIEINWLAIEKIDDSTDTNYNIVCKWINNEYKEFFIDTKLNGKLIIYPLPISICKLHTNTKYIIYNFARLSKYGAITSDFDNQFYISNGLIDILETYFECKNGNIYCIYNNKKEIVKLTLITGNKIITENEIHEDRIKIPQSLKLEIGNKKFTFYVNNAEVINYRKEGKYCFLAMHAHNNLIYGYEFKEDKYYCLKLEENLILKNIDQEKAMKFKMMEDQNFYTYLLSNNEKCGMIVNIDEDNNITHKLVKLNDKCFENILDISLLKPVKEWDNKLCVVDEFDSIVEGFDEENKDNQK